MRIVAGKYKGKALATPRSMAIRPTTDRLRETLFNILAHSYEGALDDVRVLDLFAGTGALGIEALSRGAKFVLFVDDGIEARGLIRTNIEAIQLMGCTKIFKRDATKLGPVGTTEPFSLVFADPPYGKGLAEAALTAARDGGWLRPDALVVVEEAGDALFVPPAGFNVLDARNYGESQIIILRAPNA